MHQKMLLLPLLISSVFMVGCGKEEQKKMNFVPNVSVETVKVIQYKPEQTFIGRTEAVEDVSIVPQVSGYLKVRYFNEGELVLSGQRLYQIDPAMYEAKVASAEAAVAQAKAAVSTANLDWKRGQGLLPRGGISQSEFDHLTAAKLQANAGLKSAQALLASAKLDLSHTTIVAPFTGRISQSNASIGDLVSPQTGVLTTIVSLDPMQASFAMSEKERLDMGADLVTGNGRSEESDVSVKLNLGKGHPYQHLGQLDYLGNRINTATGTIDLRAKFPNPEHRLLPGQYVEVTVTQNKSEDRLVIPRGAVQTDLEGDFVMVLKDTKVAERRNVVLGTQTTEGVIIEQGLTTSDQIIVTGLQRIRNGMTVNSTQQGA